VERSGCALVLPGPPGSGKSTLCAALISRGWRLLSDELTLLDPVTANVVPLPRPVSLKNASIAAIRQFYPAAELGPPVHDTAKGSVAHLKAPTDSVRRASELARPRWIVLPRYETGASAHLAQLSKARTFMYLAD
jgi:HprK-related kinase A